jgi:hypothetical protein
MKYLILALLWFPSFISRVSAEDRAPAEVTFNVQDDFGKPVSGATIAMSTFHHWVAGEGFGKDVSETFTGVTGADGKVTITGSSLSGSFSYATREKLGFYRGGGGSIQFKQKLDGKWQPWNPTAQIVMKEMVNPIPMYAFKAGSGEAITIPVANKAVGFDLMAADWVAPYGKGSISDLVFTYAETVPFISSRKPYDATLTISFSNEGDGIQLVRMPLNTGSELRLPRYAPETGYQSTIFKEDKRLPDGMLVDSRPQEDDHNYFFRVRTVIDKDGRVKSSLYGKIYGDFQFWGGRGLRFNYYLNPNLNDRNMEFDPRRNLFERLSPLDQVRTP